MSYSNSVVYETIRSETVIGAAYTAVGTAFTNRVVKVTFKNNTDGDVFISDDGTNNKKLFPAGSYEVEDMRTNAPNATDLTLPINLQYYIKDGPTPSTTGTFYIEAVSVRALP